MLDAATELDSATPLTNHNKRDVVRRAALAELVGKRLQHAKAIGFRRMSNVARAVRLLTGPELAVLLSGTSDTAAQVPSLSWVGDWPSEEVRATCQAWLSVFFDGASALTMRAFWLRCTGTLRRRWERSSSAGAADTPAEEHLCVCSHDRPQVQFVPEAHMLLLPSSCPSERRFLERMAAALDLGDEGMLRAGFLEERQKRSEEEAARRAREEQADAAYVQQLIDSGALKRCPRCRYGIEKNGGCLHMTCKQCAHEFWWCCLRDYRGGSHAIYSCNDP